LAEGGIDERKAGQQDRRSRHQWTAPLPIATGVCVWVAFSWHETLSAC
jgi:hypothetical protein